MKNFIFDIPDYITDIIFQLNNKGFEAYIVGGCVRDALLGKAPNDWDVCTSALPEQVADTLKGYRIVKTGIAHGTVTAVKDSNVCEITTFRCDGDYSDHRRPDSVSFTREIKTDLARRDFTINAMAYSSVSGLLDLFGGEKDLSDKCIRCVGDAEKRFTEDALRILRALRFSSTLGFEIEASTDKAIFSCMNLIDFIAKERIYNEIRRLIRGRDAFRVVCKYSAVFELIFGVREIANNAYMLKDARRDFSFRLALLFFGLPSDEILSVLKKNKADRKTIQEVLFLSENGSFPLPSDIQSARKMLSLFGREKSEMLSEYICIIHQKGDDERLRIASLIASSPVITLKELKINGSDLLGIGYKSGKQIKELLSYALDGVITDKCANRKNSLLEYISEHQTENGYKIN